jgi:hypothetical protein
MRQRYAAATGRVAEVRKHRFGKQRAFSAVKIFKASISNCQNSLIKLRSLIKA